MAGVNKINQIYHSNLLEGYELINRKSKKKILISVVAAHFFLIICPFCWYVLANWLKPEPPKVIKVTLVPPPPPAPSNPQPTVDPAELLNPEPPTPTPPKPEPVKKPEPKPEPKPVEKPKPKPKPTPKPKPKPKPTPKPKPKPKWKPLDPNKIKITKDVVKAQKPRPVISSKDLAESLRKSLSSVKISSTPSTVSAPVDYNAQAAYYQSVSEYIYPRWKQPSKKLTGGSRAAAVVHIEIDSSGRVQSASISRKSGIGAMDISVQKLLESLRSLPRPPKGITEFDITLELDD
jgi:TonB family protein